MDFLSLDFSSTVMVPELVANLLREYDFVYAPVRRTHNPS